MKIVGADCRFFGRLLLVLWLAYGSGCAAHAVRWRAPNPNLPPRIFRAAEDSDLLRAEHVYATALEREKDCSEACVDLYFEAATLTQASHAQCDLSGPLAQLHKLALSRLIISGQQFGRLDARSGLLVMSGGQRHSIPVTHHGFVWDATEFDRLEPVGDYATSAFRVPHQVCGWGIPLVVVSSCQHARPYLTDARVFAATAVLRATGSSDDCPAIDDAEETGASAKRAAESGAGESSGWALELYDPLRIDTVPIAGQTQPLAKDLSAAIAYRLRDQRRTFLDNFFTRQSAEAQSRLYTLEPYQPGTVPVVLIHGLLSDPFTWVEMVNELHASDGFVDHFQIWLFEYPTGEPFLFSAASMREKLVAAQQTLDPEGLNPQFSEMVLVGHSMGGLISKLQVTSSGDHLWRSIANRPLEQVVMDPRTRERLSEAFFFEPSPLVSRVVFIATPHGGSADARRLAGRVASMLVVEPPETRENHRQLIENNPGVFSNEFTQRVPTSIDLLDPNSALLQALYRLPIAESVGAHSIIGDARWTLGYGPSDGVVPVRSARYPYVDSERYIATTHSQVHKHVDSVDELHRILKKHLQASHRVSATATLTP